jgi:ribulose kinase
MSVIAYFRRRIGTDVRAPGGCIGPLTPPAANEMGLTCKTVVSVSLIDAYAGVLGVCDMDARRCERVEAMISE